MPLTIAEPRRVGRPQAKFGTVRILPSGYIRLSPDLCKVKRFDAHPYKDDQAMYIGPGKEVRLRYTSPHARSGLLDVRKQFAFLKVNPKEIAGEYAVEPCQGGGFYFTWANK